MKEDELINPFETEWFKNLKAQETPGGNLRFYRKLNHLTQPQLAEKLVRKSLILEVDVSRFIF